MDPSDTSGALSQKMESFARQQASARTVRRHLHRLSCYRTGLQLLFTLYHKKECVQCVFNDKSGCRNDATSCFQAHLCFAYCIMMVRSVDDGIVKKSFYQLYSPLSHWLLTWKDGIRYTFQLNLVHIDSILSNLCFLISWKFNQLLFQVKYFFPINTACNLDFSLG